MAQRLWRRRHGLPLGLDRAGRRWRRRVKLRIPIVTIRRAGIPLRPYRSTPCACAGTAVRAALCRAALARNCIAPNAKPPKHNLCHEPERTGESPHPRLSGSGRSRARRGRAVTSREELLGVGRAIAMVAEVAPEVRGERLGRKLAQRMLPARARVCLCRAATCDVLACACVCAGRVTECACKVGVQACFTKDDGWRT